MIKCSSSFPSVTAYGNGKQERANMGNVLSPKVQENENNYDPSGKLKLLNAECRNCTPTSPLECITRCRVYQLKNELRHLWEAMDNPNYIKELFNVLKNETRLSILQAIVNNTCSVSQLQKELTKTEQQLRTRCPHRISASAHSSWLSHDCAG